MCKRSLVDITLHESLGGGFSPPAAARLFTLSRVARAGQDRTRYTHRHRLSFISHHSQRISLGIIKCDAASTLKTLRRLSASIPRM